MNQLKSIFTIFSLFFILLAPQVSFADVGFFTNDDEEEILSPDEAFQLTLTEDSDSKVSAHYTIAPGHYLYKSRIKFLIEDSSTGTVANIELPTGEMKDDPNFGAQEVYHHDFLAALTINNANNPTIKAIYQGCSEQGLCYAPQTKTFALNLNSGGNSVANTNTENTNNMSDDRTTRALKSGNLWLVVSLFFVAGLLLSFTPCVLPMVPILSSIILNSQSQQQQPTKLHAFGLSVAYVLGMALTYTLAGIAAGLSGSLISQSLQNIWVLGATALIFVVLAFSMFGFYELKLPAAFESKVLNASQKMKGGAFIGVFMMGALSALVVSPCVAAPLAGALIYIGQSRDVFLGGVGLFSLAIGMGVPLLLIGASAGRLLPKAGRWMTVVRNFFGVLMLAMAAYLVWPVLPNSITAPVNKLLGLSGHTLPFERIHSVAELDQAINNANGKTVMLDFYADWCTSCKEMDAFTFSKPAVQTALKDVVLLQADVTDNNADDQALLKRFGLYGPPGIIFFDAQGQEITPKVIGYKNAKQFLTILEQVQ